MTFVLDRKLWEPAWQGFGKSIQYAVSEATEDPDRIASDF